MLKDNMTNEQIKNITLESLRDWFKKEKWVRISSSGKIAGKCGTSKNKKNPDRCLPKAKAQSLTKGQRAATAAKKKKAGSKGKTVVKNTKKATVKKEAQSHPVMIQQRIAHAKKAKEKEKSKKETANPQDGKAAPYGSGFKPITKEDIQNLVVGLLHEVQNNNFKVLKKGPYYRYLPTDDLFTDLNQLGHHGLQRSPDNLAVIKTAEELLDILDDMHMEDPERAIAFSDQNNDIINEAGELVCVKPFPSMPIEFLNDKDDEKYKKAYFTKYSNVWHHGDFVIKTNRKTFIVEGRSDATLNPGGIRIGTAEIYRHVENHEKVKEALAVGQDWEGDQRIILYLILKEGILLDNELNIEIKSLIRQKASPRHVPSKIFQVDDFPRTRSGKISELAVKDIIHGKEIKNTEALINPEILNNFRDFKDLFEE